MFESQLDLLKGNTALALTVALCLGVGALSLARLVLGLCTLLFDTLLNPGISLRKFGAGQGHWAVLTGATGDIGRALALELAKRQFNVLLVARNDAKLQALADEIQAHSPEAEVKQFQLDFAHATSEEYQALKAVLDELTVSVLINNAGISHDIPTPFHLETDKRIHDIVRVNIDSMLNITHLVVPQMISRSSGLIINSGSFSATVPSPLLSVYSGSKSFVSTWSQALGAELQPKGIVVEHLNTYFVVSAMSKIRRPSFFIPTASSYARAVLSRVGVPGGTKMPFTSIPLLSHALLTWVVENFFSRQFWIMYNRSLMIDTRKRALRKREREAAPKSD
ncbi:hypothetical protein H4R34_003042 [Dimargaris verticillata]|uniref:Very-long-chain 3-oxoacyl-CoA reductase n=1 Tax=Dimargaris verticillata TaxID=2761393 RepID=A0A9W8ECD2_9FUNG|nr:hypothetical protein H4R34_003042 [Dimargaris verticillata]